MDDFTREVIGRSLFLPPGCQVKKFVFDGTEDFLELSQVPHSGDFIVLCQAEIDVSLIRQFTSFNYVQWYIIFYR